MIQVGKAIPNIELRTDEGTPLSLTDLRGRTIALFLLGDNSSSSERLLTVLAGQTGRFLAMDASPVAVLAESVEQLGGYRDRNNVPFIILSDEQQFLHDAIMGKDGSQVGACLLDHAGDVIDILPTLPPTELVRLTLERMTRTSAPPKQNEEQRAQ